MSLTLAGLGLFSEKDISLKAIEKAKNSDKVYIELYTSKWHGNIENLKKIIGKDVAELGRKDLEDNSDKIIKEAKDQRVVIFVEGDPLCQTTHSSLLLEARKLGIKTKVIHNASILSAVGETGLHVQKFGQYITIPFPEKTKGNQPASVFEIIRENKKRGLHTLCLLDVISDENKFMKVNEGLQILLSGGVIDRDEKVVVFAKAGSDKPLIVYDSVDNLIKNNITDIPAVVIIPGKLHFTEKEYLESV